MSLLHQAREAWVRLCAARGVDLEQRLVVRPLLPVEAIGTKAEGDFAIKKGKERVVEATFGEACGQAFTDSPAEHAGPLSGVLSLDLSVVRHRAVFVASMNAVLRSLGVAEGTLHCTDEAPGQCGEELARQLEARFGHRRFGLIGLQPAILKALAERFSRDAVRLLDLDSDNIDTVKSGVEVWDGRTDLPRLVAWCDVGLATGSSIVNGTIDGIRSLFETAGKPLVFFGNTISGAAALLGLDRLCPFGR